MPRLALGRRAGSVLFHDQLLVLALVLVIQRGCAQSTLPVPPSRQTLCGDVDGDIARSNVTRPFGAILSNGTLWLWPRLPAHDAISAALGPVRAVACSLHSDVVVYCGLRSADASAVCASTRSDLTTVATFVPVSACALAHILLLAQLLHALHACGGSAPFFISPSFLVMSSSRAPPSSRSL